MDGLCVGGVAHLVLAEDAPLDHPAVRPLEGLLRVRLEDQPLADARLPVVKVLVELLGQLGQEVVLVELLGTSTPAGPAAGR